ncbi:unnamed protein product (macronuclear) [Paramecium tetraurelia]|uniref:Uncharacterized protein n=1 Tax=Paramecium tetraurelia TaxID=5888 RepID=A0CQE7_PARTE|nr:uncharacterized protein GSPATT00009362001 [Paramecium tetraurelia]CAK73014.1 unnamed protein product [Paramecium tetraurelia]|eukprot:XP_001440411.1 hypothetical protein (macronuclear) [Paramecium tetraurelia strain d4-2]
MSQYERIRPIVFQKAPEVKQVRSNSLAVRSSPSKCQLDLSFDLQVNSTTNNANQALKDINNYKKLYVSESCQNNNKENQLSGKHFSFKADENQYLKQRIKQLESQNNNYVSENKKLAHVLDQQIQLNQSLQEQQQSKNQIIKKLEDVQKMNKYQQSNNSDLKQINDQLIISKKVVNDLEEKVQIVLNENQKLSELNERFQFTENQLKIEIEKYKSKCSILESKMKQQQDESKCLELQRKIKKQNDQLEILARENYQLKQQLTQNNNQVSQQDDKQLYVHNDKFKETIQELECENQYLQQMIGIDQQKMNNLEEKLNLLTKENYRLTEIVKNRHKQQ